MGYLIDNSRFSNLDSFELYFGGPLKHIVHMLFFCQKIKNNNNRRNNKLIFLLLPYTRSRIFIDEVPFFNPL